MVINGIACRQYAPGPTDEKIEVPLIPLSCQQVLHSCHDAPSSGHQGVNKTLARLQQEAYWVGRAEDVKSTAVSVQNVNKQSFLHPFMLQ